MPYSTWRLLERAVLFASLTRSVISEFPRPAAFTIGRHVVDLQGHDGPQMVLKKTNAELHIATARLMYAVSVPPCGIIFMFGHHST
jgi:hypothetical protein